MFLISVKLDGLILCQGVWPQVGGVIPVVDAFTGYLSLEAVAILDTKAWASK